MLPRTYEDPPNGDYAAYVDRLTRASPEYQRLQRMLASAGISGNDSSSATMDSLLQPLRGTLDQARIQARNQAAQAVARGSAAPKADQLAAQMAGMFVRPDNKSLSASRSAQAAANPQPAAWMGRAGMVLIFLGVALLGLWPTIAGMLLMAGIALAFFTMLQKMREGA